MEVKDNSTKEAKDGILKRIAGPVVTAVNLDAHMYDLVQVGNEGLMGEVIKIQGEEVIIQVYEDTSGIKPGEPVINTGLPLAVELGPTGGAHPLFGPGVVEGLMGRQVGSAAAIRGVGRRL